MGRPARPLADHLRQGTFRARRHHALLAGPDVSSPGFARLQARYRAATSEPERRAVAREFEQTLTQVHAAAAAEDSGHAAPTLNQELLKLGKPGSPRRLLGFFPHFLQHSKGPMCGQPFQLEPWQMNFLRELYRRDQDGRRIYKRAVLGIPHGNGKTALAAGLGLYELVSNTDSPEVYLAAGAKQQAQIGLDNARNMVEHGPLADWISTGSTLRCQHRGGRLEALSSQGALQHGRAPSAALIDELGTFTTTKQHETYTALATAIHKRPDAYLLATTTAGPDHDSLLGRIYHQALNCDDVTMSRNGCLTIAKNPAAGTLLWWYGAPADADPEDPKIIRACNPASWIAVQALQQQACDAGLDENDFRRHHLNQWTRTGNASRNATVGRWNRHTHALTPAQAAERERVRQGLVDVARRNAPGQAGTAEQTPGTAD
jgi:phage terminase large subunit-like protein